MDKERKYVVIIWGAITGFTFFYGAYLEDFDLYRDIWSSYLKKEINSDSFLTTILAVLTSIYAVALPLSINTVSKRLSVYGDKEVVNWFKNKWEIYYQRVIVPLLMIYIIILMFFNEKNGFGCLVILFGVIYTLIMCISFFKTIMSISVDTSYKIIDWSSKTAKSKLK